MRSTLNDLTDGENILVDFTVAGPTAQIHGEGQLRSGVLAAHAEQRKLREVHNRWKLHPNVRPLPFAIEYTGGLGEIARRFLDELFEIPKPPDAAAPHAASLRDARDLKMQALYRFKASITASIWRGNYYIFDQYMISLRAKAAAGTAPVADQVSD